MPTNEERREAAAWIRNGAHDIDINGYIKLAINVVDRGDGATWGQLALKLADLIEPEPERTCKRRNHDTDNYYMRCCSCSECNAGWFEDIYDKPFSYCPHCGAKVIEE